MDWYIIKGREAEFKSYWETALPVMDRSQLIGEFLSEPTGHEIFPWVTWDLRSPDAARFINVGLWASTESFHEQIGRYFNPAKGKLEFEFILRKRALLSPSAWRMGQAELPLGDTENVL